MRKTTLAIVGAVIVAAGSIGAIVAANADDAAWGWGRGGHHRMFGGDGEGPTGGPGGPGGPGFGFMGGPAGGPMQMLKAFDTDGDGKITQAEIDAGVKARFAEANTDGGAGVSIQEFEPFFWKQHREMMVRAFQMLDRDGDGQVTEAEAADMAKDMVARRDRDGDGAISPEDRMGRRGDHRGWRWGRGGEVGPEQGPGGGQGPMGQGPMGQGPGNGPGPGPAPAQ